MNDPSSPMANPGRRRLVEDLTAERFGANTWFRTIPPQVEDPQMQALRQLEINEAVDDDEEAPDGPSHSGGTAG